MIATLQFNLPDEQTDFELAVHALDWRNVVFDLDQWLRDCIKHHNMPEYQPVRDHLNRLCVESHLNLFE